MKSFIELRNILQFECLRMFELIYKLDAGDCCKQES